MWVAHGIEHQKPIKPTTLTIGAFDGVHLGHQALIRTVVNTANSHAQESVIITFSPLPLQVFRGIQFSLLTALEEKLVLLENLEVDGVITIPFSPDIQSLSALSFIDLLVKHVNLSNLWIGPDFRFGKNREGDLNLLTEAGKHYNFNVHAYRDTVLWAGAPVHSSRIRKALRSGNLDEVNGCLGRPYSLTGTVEHGDSRGRALGFPTANLQVPEERMLPANGVYLAQAWIFDEAHIALVNVGTRPTFDHHPPNVEAHLLNFTDNIYGLRLRLEFLHYIRPELRFPSADALVKQMHKDKNNGLAWWSSHKQAL
ncbi:MAG: riboflavin biosynthesis protein RibF [Anaerolineae bacterium]|nr:riboflavin biosynthesis protein RibF [Anaerolineae bacterium]